MPWELKRRLSNRFNIKKLRTVVALKANHPTLHAQVKDWFDQAQANNFEEIEFNYDL
jgi:hypothetical protein